VVAFARKMGIKTCNIVRRESLVAELAAIGADATGENYCVAYLWDALLTQHTVVDGVDLKARVTAVTGFSLCDTKHFSSSRHDVCDMSQEALPYA
jgi:hypothetical protein